MVKNKTVTWTGSHSNCDICRQPLGTRNFVDGKTAFGPWALMCLGCARDNGVKYGTGLGQLYDGKTRIKLKG